MNRIRTFLLFTLVGWCLTSTAQSPEEIQIVKQFVKSSPDSAQLYIESIQHGLSSNERLQLYLVFIADLLDEGRLAPIPNILDQLQLDWESYADSSRFSLFGARYTYFFRQQEFDSAFVIADQMLQYAQEVEDDYATFNAYINLGEVHEHAGLYTEGLSFFQEALKIAEELDDDSLKGMVYIKFGVLYSSIENSQMALDYNKLAHAIFAKNSSTNRLIQIDNNIGLAYSYLDQFDSAEYYFRRGLTLAKQLEFNFGMAITRLNLGMNAEHSGQYQEAMIYLDSAFDFFKATNDAYGQVLYYMNYSRCLTDIGKTNEAIVLAEKGLILAEQQNLLNEIEALSQDLSELYAKVGNYRKAYENQVKHEAAADSLMNAEKEREMGRLESKYALDRSKYVNHQLSSLNSSQGKSLKLQRMLTYSLLIGFIAVAILLIVIYRLYQKKKYLGEQREQALITISHQNDELERTNNLKSQFFANISHELRTPLTLIQGNADAILRINKLSAEAVEPANKIKGNVKQMTSLVNDLLDLSKVELKKNVVNLKPIYFDPLVSRIVAAFSSLAESNQIDLKYISDISAQTVVDIDEAQFEKVLNNIIYNSFKFVGSGGEVEVITVVEEAQVILKVTDNGAGIPDADMPYIFDRFYQVGGYNDSIKGSGLGLAISRELIEQMNGQISANNNIDGGALLKVVLPLSDLVPTVQNDITTSDVSGSLDVSVEFRDTLKVPSDTSILIVEDNRLLQAYLSDILGDHFELHVADDGQQALDLLKQIKPDLILTDVMMPVMDGWTMLENIQSDMALSKIPVIVLTAVAESSDKIKGLRLGVDDYIIKPFEVEELLIRISNVINNLRERIKWAREFEEEHQDLTEENQLVLNIRDYVKNNIGDRKLNVTQLAMYLGLSERQLYRKTAESVGLSPSKLISEIRLQHARELLVSRRYDKLAQITNEIGLESASYFSKLYQERFGKKPSDYFS
ncbi:hybrid sensor histidine kinase/response regulator transcription factor [Marinoscillum pacificum]|uniref:hybrid sensor histidine kinase/response regulator transcription factor n=1 Tax=Marinoscillum pacificum TaxID=392723 RepID=UPI00215817D1|nr:response regulator [Marinoscillum pacificum]